MPTNNKTSLGLNNWIGTDKPKRSDFVEDNTTLDFLLTTHFNDTAKHITAADRAFLTESFVVGNYTGNGALSQVLTLPFEPRMVIVFMEQASMNLYVPSASFNQNNFGIVTKMGGSMGLVLSAAKLTVTQTQKTPTGGGILIDFNSNSDEYVYIAFR